MISACFGISELNNAGNNPSTWRAVEAFVRKTQGVASRVAFGRTGALILTTIPEDPNSGAFYLYDQPTRTFYSITFQAQDLFNPLAFEWENTVADYDQFMMWMERREDNGDRSWRAWWNCAPWRTPRP